MDFENNKINTTIWKYLNEAEAAIKDNGKPLIPFDYNFAGTIIPITLDDNFIVEELLKDTINKTTRMEALKRLMLGLSEKERAVITIFNIENTNIEEFTDFDCLQYHNRVLKKLENINN